MNLDLLFVYCVFIYGKRRCYTLRYRKLAYLGNIPYFDNVHQHRKLYYRQPSILKLIHSIGRNRIRNLRLLNTIVSLSLMQFGTKVVIPWL